MSKMENEQLPMIIRSTKIKIMIFPAILLCLVVLLWITEAALPGLLLFTALFLFFTLHGLLSFAEYLVFDETSLIFYESKNSKHKIGYSDINKIDLEIISSVKSSRSYLEVYKSGKSSPSLELDFSDYFKKDLRKIVQIIAEKNPKVHLTPKICRALKVHMNVDK